MQYKNKKIAFIHLISAWLLLITSASSIGLDVVVTPPPQSQFDHRDQYKTAVLTRALELTVPEYGPYKIDHGSPRMNRKRAIKELATGKYINLYFALDHGEANENTIRIPIPARLGILNYRLLLIHKDNIDKFANITHTDQLKSLLMGSQRDWNTSEYLEKYGFNWVGASDYEGIFNMLYENRFDYILRGVNEVYQEIEQRPHFKSVFYIVPDIAIYVPLTTYTYVSPNHPRLAERVKLGMQRMVDNGDLRALFEQRYRTFIEQADLCSRKLLFIDPAHEQIFKEIQNLYKPCKKLPVASSPEN